MSILQRIVVSTLLLLISTLVFATYAMAEVSAMEISSGEAIVDAGGKTCPVGGETTFKDTWNARRPNRRRHKGTDMRAERNTPLAAVETGTIIRLRYDRAGGRTIYTEGLSGTVYFYAHLNRYAEGQRVGDFIHEGSVVGYVGRSGNADAYHLHFGYRPDGTTPENPYSLLQSICNREADDLRWAYAHPNAKHIPW